MSISLLKVRTNNAVNNVVNGALKLITAKKSINCDNKLSNWLTAAVNAPLIITAQNENVPSATTMMTTKTTWEVDRAFS
jgi:hypothetical protein